MFLDSSGKVGIGNIAPQQKLDVSGKIKADAIYLTRSNGDVAFTIAEESGTNGYNITASGGSSFIRFYTNNGNSSAAERMRIHTNGYVGIGTDSPEHTLDVNGTIRATKSIESIALNDGYWSGGIRIDGTETIRPSVGFHIPNLYGRRLFMEETKGDLMWECSSTSGKPTYYILHSGNY
jgi:hypothetical protein